jgi:hypothetical protein
MSITLSKTDTAPYDYVSESDGSNPLASTVVLDASGGTEDSEVITVYVVATTYNYTAISISTVNEDAGIDWKLSLNNVDWYDTVEPGDMDATSDDQVTTIYAKAVVTDDGSVPAGTYATPDITVEANDNAV